MFLACLLTSPFRPFFRAADGIFLNYNWNDESLKTSLENADKESRKGDVYVGVDVFGRGCFGGGGLNMWKVKKMISL